VSVSGADPWVWFRAASAGLGTGRGLGGDAPLSCVEPSRPGRKRRLPGATSRAQSALAAPEGAWAQAVRREAVVRGAVPGQAVVAAAA
jgi:hypothetical protein